MRRWVCLLLLLCSVAWAEAQSSRLAQLEQEMSAEALAAFWLEMGANGGPIIEPWDQEHSLVTFVYRGNGGEKRVVLLSGVAPRDPADCLLTRMSGTNLWYRSEVVANDVRTTYRFSVDGTLIPFSKVSMEEFLAEMADEEVHWRTDPFNGVRGESYSVLEMPEAEMQPYSLRWEGVQRGAVAVHKFESELLGNKRKLRVYVPPHYSEDAQHYPLVILFDGRDYDRIANAPLIFDNLISAGKVPPFVGLLISNASPESRNAELPCNPMFGRFMVEEMLPWIDAHYNVSRYASDVVVGGASFGGLAAVYLALEYPEYFGNVLSQAGAVWWKPVDEEEHSWVIRQFRERDPVPVRFYLDIGNLETLGWFGGPSMLDANRELRDVLVEKGNNVTYLEYPGGHDYVCWRGTLPEGLMATLNREE